MKPATFAATRLQGAGLDFWGGSFLADPFGRIIAQASHDKEEILLGTVDVKLQEEIRRNWPFLRDRRIDAYGPITAEVWKVDDAQEIAAASPHRAGYRMPAEWEPQRATWLAWPHNRTDWPGKFQPIPYVYAESCATWPAPPASN